MVIDFCRAVADQPMCFLDLLSVLLVLRINESSDMLSCDKKCMHILGHCNVLEQVDWAMHKARSFIG